MSELTKTIHYLTENPVLWDESNIALLIEKARQAALELEQWHQLRDPMILHTNLLRNFPAQLTPQQLIHIAGENWHIFWDKYPSINQSVIIYKSEWQLPKIMTYSEPFIFNSANESFTVSKDEKIYWKELPQLP